MGSKAAPQPVADQSAQNIVNLINAAAKARQSNTELQKQLLLDQVSRARNRQDKMLERKDEMNAWNNAYNDDGTAQSTGMANSQTPNNVGLNPNAPAPDMGYNVNNPPPMSMAPQFAGLNQQPKTVSPTAPATSTAVAPVAGDSPNSQLKDLGFTPIGVGQLAMTRKGVPEAKDYAYIQALNKAKRGVASEGELQLIRDFNGYKDKGEQVLPGFDTVNLSPDQLRIALQEKNPSRYSFLESVKNGKINLGGRSSKEMNKVMQEVQALWPGTDLTMVQTRIKTRQDFTSGKESQNIKALNTAIGHLNSLHEIVPKLNNTGAWIWNAPAQEISGKTGIGLNKYVKQFNFTKAALSDELAAVFKATGATDVSIKNIKDEIDAADSPEVINGVISRAVDLLDSRLMAIQDKWENTFFFEDDEKFPVLSDSSKAIVAKIGSGSKPEEAPVQEGSGWTSEKEARYQELLMKRNQKNGAK